MPKLRTFALPALVSLLTLAFTALAWHLLHSQHLAARQAAFTALATQIQTQLQQQLEYGHSLLHGGQAHYAQSGASRLGEFLAPQLAPTKPAGLLGLSHAPLIGPEQLEDFILAQQREHSPDFSIRPAGQRPLYAPVSLALNARGKRPLEAGQDLFADPELQRILTQARDSGETVLSGRLQLKNDQGDFIPGFVMVSPLFAPGQARNSIAERRSHLQGWLIASFNLQEWLRESLGPLNQEVELLISRDEGSNAAERIHPAGETASAAQGLVSQDTLQLGDNRWQLRILAQPAFITRQGGDPAKSIVLLGMVLSGLLFYLSMHLSAGRLRHAAEAERLQDALHEAEERWRFALEGSGDGVWDWDVHTGQVSFSPRCDAILGVSDGQAAKAVIHPEDEAAERAAMQACLEGKSSQYFSEHRMQGADGQWRWIAARGMVVARSFNGAAARMIGTMSDITERKTANEKLQGMAQLDGQTGLPNRTLFFDRLQQALRMARRKRETLALICVDIDNFKAVNDNFGQALANQLLREVAARLNQTMRDSDTVAHFSGDDFAILLPTLASDADAHLVTDKLREAFSREFIINNRHIGITLSIGAALFPQHARSAETLLNSALRALQQAKKSGGDGVCFSLNAKP